MIYYEGNIRMTKAEQEYYRTVTGMMRVPMTMEEYNFGLLNAAAKQEAIYRETNCTAACFLAALLIDDVNSAGKHFVSVKAPNAESICQSPCRNQYAKKLTESRWETCFP